MKVRNRVKLEICKAYNDKFEELHNIGKQNFTHNSGVGLYLTQVLRKKLGYSETTWGGDILYLAYKMWLEKVKKKGK